MLRDDPPYADERMTSPFHCYRASVRETLDAQTLDVTVDLGFGIHKQVRVDVYGVEADPIDPDEPKSPGCLQAARTATWVHEGRKGFDGEWPFAIRTMHDETGAHGAYRAEVFRRDTTGDLREWLLREYPEMAR